MNKYTISDNGEANMIDVTALIDVSNSNTFRLAAWRPGRYELSNFGQNIHNLEVFDSLGLQIKCSKIDREAWQFKNENLKVIQVNFKYWCPLLNAGSCYPSSDFLYINPINLCLYTESKQDEGIEIELINRNGDVKTWNFTGIDRLFDSPLVLGQPNLTYSYTINNQNFYIDFFAYSESLAEIEKRFDSNGEYDYIDKFNKFTQTCFDMFGSFPFPSDYHFTIFIRNEFIHHGVEHLDSTVIVLGSYILDDFRYLDYELLSISCHELFHSWNVKTIRPTEMMPYNYAQECYSQLHYITEGITTYYGDYLLLSSGCIDDKTYLTRLNDVIAKFMTNDAIAFHSLANASIDSWLDGYKPNAPTRRISFYNEGSLWALVLDLKIRIESRELYKLADLMRLLYQSEQVITKGYNEQLIRTLLNEMVPSDWDNFFQLTIHSPAKYIDQLLLEYFESESYSYAILRHNSIFEDIYIAGASCTVDRIGRRRINQLRANSVLTSQGAKVGDYIILLNEDNPLELTQNSNFNSKKLELVLVNKLEEHRKVSIIVPELDDFISRPKVFPHHKVVTNWLKSSH
ncbi:MAG: hypothetical protein SGJ04_04865 [Bacteroidota bacterium]|nr:hypothetical protein [Bacteroidota bacterium]